MSIRLQAPLRPSQSTISLSGFRSSGRRYDAPTYGDDGARKQSNIPRKAQVLARAFHRQTIGITHKSAHAGQQDAGGGDSATNPIHSPAQLPNTPLHLCPLRNLCRYLQPNQERNSAAPERATRYDRGVPPPFPRALGLVKPTLPAPVADRGVPGPPRRTERAREGPSAVLLQTDTALTPGP